MNRQNVKILGLAVVLSLLLNIFLGKSIAARLSTWPVLNKFRLLDPQAPIVINKKEEIRISEDGNGAEEVSKNQSRFSLLVQKEKNGIKVLGGAVNLTSDGWYATVKYVLPQQNTGEIWKISPNKDPEKVTLRAYDPASELVFFFTKNNTQAVAVLGDITSLSVGEKVAFLEPALKPGDFGYVEGRVSSLNFSQVVYDAGMGQTGLLDFSVFKKPEPGQLLVGRKSEVFGIMGVSGMVSSGEISQALASFQPGEKSKFLRPYYGFSFRDVSDTESKILGIEKGVVITDVEKSSPAQSSGIKAGDRIVETGGKSFASAYELSNFLKTIKPQSQLRLKVFRENKTIEVVLQPVEYK